jgi:hypothetical protein
MWPGLPMWPGLLAVPVVIPQSSVRSALSDVARCGSGPVGSTDRRLAHDAGVRTRGGARGRYRVWTQDGIVLSLCASDILTCVFG